MRMRLAPALLLTLLCAGGISQTVEPPLPPTVATGATLEEIFGSAPGEAPPMYEGPVWDPGTRALYFTSCRAEQVLRLTAPGQAEVWMEGSGGINGMVLGRDGRLLGAVVMGHRIDSVGIGPTGPTDVRTLASDETWNQPNDVTQSARGDIYFTDPSWVDHARSGVYRLSPEGEVSAINTGLAVPNGILASSDGRTLYVSDSHQKTWWAFPIHPDGSVGAGRLFFDPATENRDDPDGMTADAEGNLYFAGRGGVWVVSPRGEALGLIPTPTFCSNVAFGGEDGTTLFLTGRGKVWRLAMRVRGAR